MAKHKEAMAKIHIYTWKLPCQHACLYLQTGLKGRCSIWQQKGFSILGFITAKSTKWRHLFALSPDDVVYWSYSGTIPVAK